MDKEQVPQFETMCKVVKRGHLLEIHKDHVLFGFTNVSDAVDDAMEAKQAGYHVGMTIENNRQITVFFK